MIKRCPMTKCPLVMVSVSIYTIAVRLARNYGKMRELFVVTF